MRTSDPEIRKQELVELALEIFLEEGYETSNVNHIAKRAGVTRGLLYYYFRSKEEMLVESVKLQVQKFTDAVMDLGLTQDTPPLEAFKLVLLGAFQYFSQNLDFATNIHKPENTFLHNTMSEISIEYLSPIITGIIQRGNDSGVMHCPFPDLAAAPLVYGIMECVHVGTVEVTGADYFEKKIQKQKAYLIYLLSALLFMKEEHAAEIFQW